MSTKKNIWKWLFFALIAIQLLFVFWLFQMTTQSKFDSNTEEPPLIEKEGFVDYFSLHFTREQLNRILREEMGEANTHIQLTEDSVRFTSSLGVLGQTINAVMDFEASTMENGNMVLRERNFTIGRLSLPGTRVLSLLQSQGDLPEFVIVQPDQNRILIRLDQFDRAAPYYIRAEEFSLMEEELYFKVGKYNNQE